MHVRIAVASVSLFALSWSNQGQRALLLPGLMLWAWQRPEDLRWWLRLHDKNGKVNEMPCHYKLENYLDAYPEAAGSARGASLETQIGVRPSAASASPIIYRTVANSKSRSAWPATRTPNLPGSTTAAMTISVSVRYREWGFEALSTAYADCSGQGSYVADSVRKMQSD